jgi:hypothetical protein
MRVQSWLLTLKREDRLRIKRAGRSDSQMNSNRSKCVRFTKNWPGRFAPYPFSNEFSILCYAIMLPGRNSAFRDGFWPDCYRKDTQIGLPVGIRFTRPPCCCGLRMRNVVENHALKGMFVSPVFLRLVFFHPCDRTFFGRRRVFELLSRSLFPWLCK